MHRTSRTHLPPAKHHKTIEKTALPMHNVKSSGTGGGGGMEERVAKLEATTEHILREVGDIKTDVRDLRSVITSIDKKLDVIQEQLRHIPNIWTLITTVIGALLAVSALQGYIK